MSPFRQILTRDYAVPQGDGFQLDIGLGVAVSCITVSDNKIMELSRADL